MSTNVGSIHYDLSLDTSKFDKASAGLASRMNSIGSGMTDIGKKMTLGVTLPVVAGFAYAVKSASDLNETLNKVEVAFGNNAKQVKDWSKNSINSMGLAQQSALDATALFGDMATSMGLTTQQASTMSMGLTQLGADLASFKNISFKEAQTALAGVFTGETESLKHLGIVMTETNLLEYARSKGINKTVQEMTQAEKVQLRYNYVMDATKNAQGDFARTSGGTANQLRITQERFKQLSAEVGANFLPIANRILEVIQNVISKFQALSPKQQNMIFMFLGIAAVVGPLLIIFGSLITAITAIATVVGGISLTFGIVIVAVLAVIGILIFLETKFHLVSRAIGNLKQGISAMVEAFKNGDRTSDGFVGVMERVGIALRYVYDMFKTYLLPILKQSWQAMKDSFESVKNALAPYKDQLIMVAKILGGALLVGIMVAVGLFALMVATIVLVVVIVAKVIGWLARLTAVIVNFAIDCMHWFQDAYQTTVRVFTGIMNAIMGAMSAVWNFISPILNFIKNLYIIVFGGILLIVITVVQTIYNFLYTVWSAIWNITMTIFTAIWNFVSGIWLSIFNTIVGIVQSILNFFAPAFNWLYGKGRDIVQGLANGISAMAGAVWGAVKWVADRIGSFFGGAGSWLYHTGTAIVQGLVNGLRDMAGQVARVAQDIANTVTSKIKGALGIRSPSKVMFGFGGNIAQGLVDGISSGMNRVENIAGQLASQVSAPTMQVVGNPTMASNTNETNINGNIMLGDSGAVDNFFNRLNRNGELSRKGLTTL